MAEKQKEQPKSKSKSEESARFEDKKDLKHRVTVVDKTFTVNAKKGITLRDLLKEFLEKNPNPNLKIQEMTIMFNGTPVEVKNGEISDKDNHVIIESCELILTQKITGGISPA